MRTKKAILGARRKFLKYFFFCMKEKEHGDELVRWKEIKAVERYVLKNKEEYDKFITKKVTKKTRNRLV